MLRLTREGKPNLFIYKSQIRSISEVGPTRRTRASKEAPAEKETPAAQEAAS